MINKFIATCLLASSSLLVAASGYRSEVWSPDCGDGYYVNPIINADYSDPDVVAVGDDFYMTASSFQCVPGLPILHSNDLVNWEIVNYALDKLVPEDFYNTPRHGKGVWAPSIRYHEGEYFIYWGDPDFGIYMVKTTDPRGGWSEPLLVKGGKGMIDPCPLWDEDGNAYLVNAWAASRSGFNSVLTMWKMNPEGSQLIGNPIVVFDGNDGVNHTVEGPKLYKKDGWYYILCPAGGVEQGWQLALRSRNIFGPYESKIVMAQGKSPFNGPHQGGLVDTATGESWFINFQDKGLYGRVLHLNPVKWIDEWPIMGNNGTPVERYRKPAVNVVTSVMNPQESDDFNSLTPGLQWEWHANYDPAFGMMTAAGAMRLYGYRYDKDFVNFWSVPNLFLQKFPAEEFTATAAVTVSAKSEGNESGVIVMGHDYARLSVKKESGDKFSLRLVECHDAEQGGRESDVTVANDGKTIILDPSRKYEAGLHPNYELSIYLRVKVAKQGICNFFYSLDGKHFTPIGKSFKARQGKWIGAKIGMFSISPAATDRGWIDIDNFKVEIN